LSEILIADGEGHKSKETGAIPMNQLVDIIKLSSDTLLSREAKNGRGVSGMHMGLDAYFQETGYDPLSFWPGFSRFDRRVPDLRMRGIFGLVRGKRDN
jgi:hypothetical protein